MKRKIIFIFVAVIALLLTVATPVLASVPKPTPTTKSEIAAGAGWFKSEASAPYPPATPGPVGGQKILFDLWVKLTYANDLNNTNGNHPVTGASGKFQLTNLNTKTFVNGRVEGILAPIVGADLYLFGHCTINGKGSYYFEVLLWDEGKGIKAIGKDRVDFWIPPDQRENMYFMGNLCGGDIYIPSNVNLLPTAG